MNTCCVVGSPVDESYATKMTYAFEFWLAWSVLTILNSFFFAAHDFARLQPLYVAVCDCTLVHPLKVIQAMVGVTSGNWTIHECLGLFLREGVITTLSSQHVSRLLCKAAWTNSQMLRDIGCNCPAWLLFCAEASIPQLFTLLGHQILLCAKEDC